MHMDTNPAQHDTDRGENAPGEHFDELLRSIEPEAWERIRWMRDQLAGCDRVLLVGRHTAALAVLLLREGQQVSAIETERRWVEAFGSILEREGLSGDDCTVHPSGTQGLADAFAAFSPDAIAVLDGPAGQLESLVALVNGEQGGAIQRLVLALPFGSSCGGAGHVLPRALVDGFGPGLTVELEVRDGYVHLVGAVDQDNASTPTDLLALTEQGVIDVLGRQRDRLTAAERELLDLREALNEAERVAAELRSSTSFRLGLALVTAVRSPKALLTLPMAIVRVLRNRRVRDAEARAQQAKAKKTGLSEWEKEQIRGAARQAIPGGVESVVAAVAQATPDASRSVEAFALLVGAQACGVEGRHDLEFEVASRALELNRSIGMLRGYLHVALRCRQMEAASATLAELHAAARSGNVIAEKFIAAFKETSSYKIAVLEAIPPRRARWSSKADGRIAYVLHNSLPYSSGGYATRSHGVATALKDIGLPVVCVTRPGFPLDMKQELAPVDVPAVDIIDGVPYQRVSEPQRTGLPEYKYVLAAAKRMTDELARMDVSYVQAASNYVTGIPALIAARRLGVPFFYEVRGLWEITRMSRDDKFAKSISFDVQRHLEGSLAREADHVFTLTEPMREELIERGVDPERITLLPNSVDADRFLPAPRDQGLARELGVPDGVPVIGYVGTFVIYEGLEHLAEACVALHQKGHDFRLLLVGNENASGQDRGPITQEILDICTRGGIADKLIMPGRIPHEQVAAYYSLIDICPFPRKPWPVCEMVSPMKPLEALAMEKAVVVSSVRALTEMIQDGVTGVVFEKGNTESLADAMESLLQSPERRAALGRAGREFVSRARSWAQIAARIQAVKQRFDEERRQQAEDVSESEAVPAVAAAAPTE